MIFSIICEFKQTRTLQENISDMNEEIAKRLRYCPSLPSLPAVALRIVELTHKSDTGMAEISAEVSKDPALAAKFLRLAHSPLYQTRRTATNIRQAVSLLGTHAAMMVALSFSLMDAFRSLDEHQDGDPYHFWRQAMLSALACRALGEECGIQKLDDLFLAGLLQDIGVLAYEAMMPDEYARVNRPGLTNEALRIAEREAFGAGHDEVGQWLLKRWNLPDYLSLSCLAAHSLTQQPEAMSKMTACIAVSGLLAEVFLFAGDTDAVLRCTDAARNYLGLSDDRLHAVMEMVGARIPEAEKLFDVPILKQAEISAIMTEAKDLQMMRQLQKAKELENHAQRDALTGAHNRGYLDIILQREFELSSVHGWPLSVAMIDLDHFKTINDNYGHPAGDSVLISIVHALQSQLRPDDVFARYGGEEFIIILPGTNLKNAVLLLSRLQETISNLDHVMDDGTHISVTASIGVLTHMDGGIRFIRKEDIIRAVDQTMYAAKHLGRNRIEVWNGETEGTDTPE